MGATGAFTMAHPIHGARVAYVAGFLVLSWLVGSARLHRHREDQALVLFAGRWEWNFEKAAQMRAVARMKRSSGA